MKISKIKKIAVFVFLWLLFSSVGLAAGNGVGDFNSDGKSDLFWYDPISQNMYLWLMGDASEGQFLVEPLDAQFVPVVVSDINGDGNDDIFFKYVKKGQIKENKNRAWLMNGQHVGGVFDFKQINDLSLDLETIYAQESTMALLQSTDDEKILLWQEPGLEIVPIPLKLNCSGASEMMISEDSDFSDTVWEPFAAEKYFFISPEDGEKIIYSKFRNELGKEVQGVPVNIVMDTQHPVITIQTPSDKQKTIAEAITVEGVVSKPCFKVLVNEKEAVLNGNTFSMGMVLHSGENTIQVTAIDLNGNISHSEQIKVIRQS